jgi:hypothetical protein
MGTGTYLFISLLQTSVADLYLFRIGFDVKQYPPLHIQTIMELAWQCEIIHQLTRAEFSKGAVTFSVPDP